MQSKRALKEYVGEYDNPTGALKIEKEGQHLVGTYNLKSTPLVRLADDHFEATAEGFNGFKITFISDKNGFVERAIVDMGERGNAAFTREVKPRPVSAKFLKRC